MKIVLFPHPALLTKAEPIAEIDHLNGVNIGRKTR